MKINTSETTRQITLYDDSTIEQTIYRVNRRICCFIEEYSDKYRVSLGKPSMADTLSWSYPKTEDGLHEAQKKVKAIVDSTITWYQNIS